MGRTAGVAAISGIGFTISLLVVDLAFDGDTATDQARIGVLCASVAAFLLAWLIFPSVTGSGRCRCPPA